MITIYAQSFMTATRTDCVNLRDVPSTKAERRRWFWPRQARCIDLSKL